MSTEQNYDMIDGLRNNMASPQPDLADGRTKEDASESTPKAYTEARDPMGLSEYIRINQQPIVVCGAISLARLR